MDTPPYMYPSIFMNASNLDYKKDLRVYPFFYTDLAGCKNIHRTWTTIYDVYAFEDKMIEINPDNYGKRLRPKKVNTTVKAIGAKIVVTPIAKHRSKVFEVDKGFFNALVYFDKNSKELQLFNSIPDHSVINGTLAINHDLNPLFSLETI